MKLRNHLWTIVVAAEVGLAGQSARGQQPVAADADAVGVVTTDRSSAADGQKFKGFAPVLRSATGRDAKKPAEGVRKDRDAKGQKSYTFRSSKLLGTRITDASGQAAG